MKRKYISVFLNLLMVLIALIWAYRVFVLGYAPQSQYPIIVLMVCFVLSATAKIIGNDKEKLKKELKTYGFLFLWIFLLMIFAFFMFQNR